MSSLERADPVILEKQIKAKWMNEYISEINNKSSRKQLEVSNLYKLIKLYIKIQIENKLQLEKEHNECLIKEALQQRERNLKYKMEITNKLSQEYRKAEEEKRLRKLKEDEEYKLKQSTSLDHKYDQHVNYFKNKVSSLSDRVDSNAQSYLKYKNACVKDDYNKKIEEFQDRCFNSIKKSHEVREDKPRTHNNLKSELDNYINNNQKKISLKEDENTNHQGNDNNLEFNPDIYKLENPFKNNSNEINISNDYLNNYDNVNSMYNQNNYGNYNDYNNLNFNSSIKKPENLPEISPQTHISSVPNNNLNYYSLDKIRQHSPSYKQFYSFNPEKEYNLKETTTSIRNNIIAHNNAHHLEEIYKKSKSNYTAINKSILDFNKEQVKYKDMAKILEDENKRKLIEERLKESQKIKLENIESNIVRHQKQVNYKNILDHQLIPNYGVNNDQDKFKFYVTPKNYFLGGTQLDHNPIINPVNNYNFAKYYLQRNNMTQSMKQTKLKLDK